MLREVRRVLVPEAPLVITFSNRCFPTKVVGAWRVLNEAGHIRLISHYLEASGPWAKVRALRAEKTNPLTDPLSAVITHA